MNSPLNPFSFLSKTTRNSNSPPPEDPTLKKRSLLLHKVSKSSPYQNYYQTAHSSLFSNSSTFFSSTYDGKEVIIGKKNSSFRIAPIKSHLNPLTRLIRRSLMHHESTKSIRKSNISCLSSLFAALNAKNSNLLPNQHYIDETELNQIYNDFKSLHKHNTISAKLTPTNRICYKDNMSKLFNMQEKALMKIKENAKQTNKMIEYISKKSKKCPNELLFNKVNDYRIRKELQNEREEKMKKMNSNSIYDWQLTLRQDPPKAEVNYLNIGTDKNPKWQMVVNASTRNVKEIIRNPSVNEVVSCKNEMRKYFKNNNNNKYLKECFSNKTIDVADHRKLDLEIKGKDLLKFEQDNSKLLGKRKILSVYNLGDDMKNMVVFSSNFENIKQTMPRSRNGSV
jgi:hypothetical protein